MSGNDLSVRALTAQEQSPVSRKWLEMQFPETVDSKGESQPQVNADNGAVKVKDDTNQFIRLVNDPLNLISVIGPARSGKSTLMNLLSGSKSDLFATSPGFTTFTKGVYIPSKMMTLPDFSSLEHEPVVGTEKSNVKISFVDTEGQGAMGDIYDMNLFSPALLTSKIVIYNHTNGLLTAQILSQLGMMTQAGQRLLTSDTKSKEDDNAAHKKPFGHLVILFNQFRLAPDFKIDQLQKDLLGDELGKDAATLERNNIRKLLYQCFKSIQVFVLPERGLKPEVEDEREVNKSRFLTMDDFRDKYVNYFKTFRTALSQLLLQPHELVPDAPLTGGAIADFVPKFANAINAQEPLNVPSLFASSRNDAINKALSAFKIKAQNKLTEMSKEEAKATVGLESQLNQTINALLIDLTSTISYMPQEVLQKTKADAAQYAADLKEANLSLNLDKLKNAALIAMNMIVNDMDSAVRKEFVDDKLLVSRANLEVSIKERQKKIVSDYKTTYESSDSRCLPANYQTTLDDSFNSAKSTLYGRSDQLWFGWVGTQNAGILLPVRTGLDSLLKEIVAGDQRRWNSTVLTLKEDARNDFKLKVKNHYGLLNIDDVEKNFNTELEDMIATREAQWKSNDEETKRLITKKRLACQKTYSNRLDDSIIPEHQPPPFAALVDSSPERNVLQDYLSKAKVTDEVSSDTMDEFDKFVASTKKEFTNTWQTATTNFNTYIDQTISTSTADWELSYNERLDEIRTDAKADAVSQRCDEIGVTYKTNFETLKLRIGTLQADSIAALKVSSAQTKVNTSVSRGKSAKMGQFNELAALYNRALLNKLLKPIIQKSLDETNPYLSTVALDTAIETAKNDFMNNTRALYAPEGVTPESETPSKQWQKFEDRTHPALRDNVMRSAETYGIDGAQDSYELQLKVVEHVRRQLANLAAYLGLSYINSDASRWGDDPQDQGISDDAKDKSELDQPKSRTIYLKNTSTESGFWDDKKTSMAFLHWTVESSDYILGKPVINGLKPIIIMSQQFPPSKDIRSATVGATSTSQTTISNSVAKSFSWGAKVSLGLDVKMKIATTETTFKAATEASFGGGTTSTDGTAIGSSFTVSGSSTVELPANRANIVTQVAFDQDTTVPYTAIMKIVPSVRYMNGFVTWHNTKWLKQDFFNDHEDTSRCIYNFELPRVDQLKDYADRNKGEWDWPRIKREQPEAMNIINDLANPAYYQFYVKGKWSGLTGKMVITTVTPSASRCELLPADE